MYPHIFYLSSKDFARFVPTGRRGLSGGAPCRWYINEELPEINEIHAQ
jgi:hypothetical protein